jgi:hypothetical protein
VCVVCGFCNRDSAQTKHTPCNKRSTT